jgi:hypothetical protein
LLGVLTAILLTWACVRSTDRSTGYVAVLVAVAVTAIPAVLMFLRWSTGRRPAVALDPQAARAPRAEDRLPTAVVFGHGLAALATVVLVMLLLISD